MVARKKRIVLSDVAREAGVSSATVSAVLHASKGNNSRFSETTRDKVLAAADKLGYRANRTFRNLNRKRQGVIGVALGNNALISNYTLNAMSEAAAEQDLMVIYSHSSGETPIFIKEDAVDGLVLFGDMDADFRRNVQNYEIPVIYVNSNNSKAPGSICFDEARGMTEAVKHLAKKGRRKILFLERANTDKSPHYSRELRWTTIGEASRNLGLKAPVRHTLQNRLHADLRNAYGSAEPLIEEMAEQLRSRPDVDAAILNYRILAPQFYEAARRAGKSIPEDLAVIGINPFDPIDFAWPFLTSVTLDFQRLGHMCIEQMLSLIESGPRKTKALIIPMHLVVRDSA